MEIAFEERCNQEGGHDFGGNKSLSLDGMTGELCKKAWYILIDDLGQASSSTKESSFDWC